MFNKSFLECLNSKSRTWRPCVSLIMLLLTDTLWEPFIYLYLFLIFHMDLIWTHTHRHFPTHNWAAIRQNLKKFKKNIPYYLVALCLHWVKNTLHVRHSNIVFHLHVLCNIQSKFSLICIWHLKIFGISGLLIWTVFVCTVFYNDLLIHWQAALC